MDQVVAQGVETVAVKLDIEAFSGDNTPPAPDGRSAATSASYWHPDYQRSADRRGFQSSPHASLRLFPDRFYLALLHTAPESDTERHGSAPEPDRAPAAARPAGLRLDKQRLLLAHGFTERRRRRHDIFRQIVQRHGQHLAARRLARADATAYFTTFFSSPTLPR